MKKKLPLVCIVIVNWNGGKKLYNCLKSLRMTDYRNYKVIVLDNASTDDSVRIIKKFKEVILIKSKINLGFTAGSNILYKFAFKKFSPKYICNMNNDIMTIQPNWLSLMVSELEKEKSRGICGNKLLFPDGRLQLLYLDRHPKEYTEKDNGRYDFIKEVSAVGGANILIKKDVFDKIGGTDENYFYGPDDIDYCYRARKKGFKIVYNGFSKSIHIGSFSYLNFSKDLIYFHQSCGQMIFSFRWGNIKEKVRMILNQLIRAFITRKDPYSAKNLKNLYFHKSFIFRLGLFLKAFSVALIKYKNVNNTHFNNEKT